MLKNVENVFFSKFSIMRKIANSYRIFMLGVYIFQVFSILSICKKIKLVQFVFLPEKQGSLKAILHLPQYSFMAVGNRQTEVGQLQKKIKFETFKRFLKNLDPKHPKRIKTRFCSSFRENVRYPTSLEKKNLSFKNKFDIIGLYNTE